MPRPLPSYRLHKPSGRAVVTLGGKDYYLGDYDSPESRENYHRALAEWMEARRSREASAAPSPGTDPGLTVGELILAFWRHALDHYRHPDGTHSGELDNLRVALRPVRKLYGPTPAGEFGPLALRAVRGEMARSGLARTSINDRVNRVRRAFRWAVSVELIPAAVLHALEAVPGLQKGRTAVREAEPAGPVAFEAVEATLPHLSRVVAGLVRLQLLTGMRPGEACAIRGCDLTRGDGAWTYEPASHKTAWRGRRRVIPLGPRAVSLVREFLGADPEAYLFRPADAVAEHHEARAAARRSRPTPSEEASRASAPGARHAPRYRRNTYRNAIARACDRAFSHPVISAISPRSRTAEQRSELLAWRKAHRWHPNQLRHAAATAIRAKFGLEAAQVVLGHARADVTQVYAERDLAKAAEVMREIG